MDDKVRRHPASSWKNTFFACAQAFIKPIGCQVRISRENAQLLEQLEKAQKEIEYVRDQWDKSQDDLMKCRTELSSAREEVRLNAAGSTEAGCQHLGDIHDILYTTHP